MDFSTSSTVQNSTYYKPRRFGNRICFSHRMRGGRHLSTLLRLVEKPINHCSWLAHSKGPIKICVSVPSTEDGNRSSFRNAAFSSYVEFQTTEKVQKSSGYECHTRSLQSFRSYKNVPNLKV
jgi:hypothetical protein